MKSAGVFVGLITALIAFGCDSKESKESPREELEVTSPPAQPQQAEKPAGSPKVAAKQTFVQRCVVCHGDKGAGDGPGAAAIDPKPRAFSDPEWQESVTDEHIEKVIVSGGAAVDKSPLMPGHPDLKDKPEVVAELVKIIRGFKK